MRITYVHASKFGNGALVADEFKQHLAAKGVAVDVHHVREVDPRALPEADLYLFSSPGRMGKPIGSMRRLLKKARLGEGARYALLTTEGAPKPDKKTGRMPTEEEIARWEKVRPSMNEIMQGRGFVEVAEEKIYVTGMKGPLEAGWQRKVDEFADRLAPPSEA
jgi:menaquinone-dependent protoporphyrinogen IX oxidase